MASFWLVGLLTGVTASGWEQVVIAGTLLVFGVWFFIVHVPLPIKVMALTLFLLGVVYAQQFTQTGDVGLSQEAVCTREKSVQGRVVERPVYETVNARLVVEAESGCRYVVYGTSAQKIFRGDGVVVSGKIEYLADIEDGSGSFINFLTSRGAQGVVRFGEVLVAHSSPTLTQQTREWLLGRLTVIFPEPLGSLAAAMLFDERGGLPDDIAERFRATGTSHILAISGSNISLIAGMLFVILLALSVPPWTRTIILLLCMWLYMALIDQPVSAVRASFFWTLALLAFRLSSLMSLTAIIFLTVLVMVSFDPLVLVDVGFQLSVGAVIGIAGTLFLTKRLMREGRAVGVKDVVLASVGAFMATWPIALYHFGTLSWIGAAANILIVPLMSFIYASMVAIMLVGLVHVSLAHALAWGIYMVWNITDWIAQLFSRVPYGYIENISLPLPIVWLYYGVIVGLAVYMLRRQKRSWREVWQ